jgi:hypothetical protein
MVKKIAFSCMVALVFLGSILYALLSPRPIVIRMSTMEGLPSPTLNIVYHFPPLEEGEGIIFEVDGNYYLLYGTEDGPEVKSISTKGFMEADGLPMRNLPFRLSKKTGMVPPR